MKFFNTKRELEDTFRFFDELQQKYGLVDSLLYDAFQLCML
jgi:hypothetical protein